MQCKKMIGSLWWRFILCYVILTFFGGKERSTNISPVVYSTLTNTFYSALSSLSSSCTSFTCTSFSSTVATYSSGSYSSVSSSAATPLPFSSSTVRWSATTWVEYQTISKCLPTTSSKTSNPNGSRTSDPNLGFVWPPGVTDICHCCAKAVLWYRLLLADVNGL